MADARQEPRDEPRAGPREAQRPVIALLRPRERSAEAARQASALGFEPLVGPVLESELLDGPHVDQFLGALGGASAHRSDEHGSDEHGRDEHRSDGRRFAIVVFSSDNAVKAAWDLAARRGKVLPRLLVGARVAAIGPATQASLRERGVTAEMPSEHSSAGLVRHLAEAGLRGQRVALVRSDRGTGELPAGLAAAGADVLDCPVYALRMPRDLEATRILLKRAAEGGVDAWAFTSGLTVAHTLLLARDLDLEREVREALRRGVVGAIGKPTEAALSEHGIRCDVVADEASFDVLLRGLRSKLPGASSGRVP